MTRFFRHSRVTILKQLQWCPLVLGEEKKKKSNGHLFSDFKIDVFVEKHQLVIGVTVGAYKSWLHWMQRCLVLVFTWLITLIQMWVAQASRELGLVLKADYFCPYSLSQLWFLLIVLSLCPTPQSLFLPILIKFCVCVFSYGTCHSWHYLAEISTAFIFVFVC